MFHQFEPAGVTGVVLLAESHLSVHTWPELRFAAVGVYVCDFNRENAGRGGVLAEAIHAPMRATTSMCRTVAAGSPTRCLRGLRMTPSCSI